MAEAKRQRREKPPENRTKEGQRKIEDQSEDFG